MLVELTIHASAGTTFDNQSMILLKEKDGERMLPIVMSLRQSAFLMMRVHLPLQMLMPMNTLDVSMSLLNKFGVKISYVELIAVKDGSFFCRIKGAREAEEQTLDFCQAEDGLLMAVTAQCPIYIEEDLLEAQYMKQTGKNSFALNINTLSRKMLEDALQNAVDQENYEAASRLRDELAKRSSETES